MQSDVNFFCVHRLFFLMDIWRRAEHKLATLFRRRGMSHNALTYAHAVICLVVYLSAMLGLLLLRSWPVVAAYAMLMLVLVALPRDQHGVLLLWGMYGFAYWAVGTERAENVVLLALTSVMHVGAIVVSIVTPDMVRENQTVVVLIVGAIILLPIECNNFQFAPLVAVGRLVLFVAICTLDADTPWVVRQYPLFCDSMALPFVAAAHLLSIVWMARFRPVMALPTIAATADVSTDNVFEGETMQLAARLRSLPLKRRNAD